MSDLISRAALLDAIPKNDELLSLDVRRVICDAPAVEAVPVVHGKNVAPYRTSEDFLCSICGYEGEVFEYNRDEYGTVLDVHGFPCKYCPNCGAKMDAED